MSVQAAPSADQLAPSAEPVTGDVTPLLRACWVDRLRFVEPQYRERRFWPLDQVSAFLGMGESEALYLIRDQSVPEILWGNTPLFDSWEIWNWLHASQQYPGR